MNREKILFNALLRKYFKKVRRLHSLRAANRNERRQKILSKHIDRLQEKLKSLKISLQRGVVATSITLGAIALMPESAKAQSFGAIQTNPFNLTNVGGYGFSNPSLGDLDGDGDLDLISAKYDYYSSGPYTYGYDAQIIYYENIGTNTNPIFAAPQDSPFGLTPVNQYGTHAPTFVDIDNDGDLDIMAADYYGNFLFFENTGNANSPAFAAPSTNPFSLVGIGYYSNSQPTFADLDNDGDLDLIVGDAYNLSGNQQIYYYENTGTANAPVFGAPQINPFSLNPSGSNYVHNHLFLVDIDGDGDFDLVMGDEDNYTGDGFMKFFENTGTPAAPVFGSEQINPFGLENINSENGYVFEDLDGDGLIDILAGDSNGDFYFWKGCQATTSTITTTEACQYTAPSGAIYNASGTYTDVIPNATNCDSIITINLTIEPIADIAFTDDAITICDNGTAILQLSSSQNNFDYYLRNDLNDTVVDGPVVGDGNALDFSTGNLTTSTTYNVYAEKLVPTTGLVFDGQNDYAEATGINLANTSFTVEFWAKRANTGNDDYIVAQGTSTNNNGLHIGYRGSNQFTFAFFGNDLNTPNNFTSTNWHHIAVTYDNTTGDRYIYVDGNQEATDNSGSAFLGTGNLRIGHTPWGGMFSSDPYEGSIDELRIWNTARTQTEIMDNMNECLTGTEAGLISYYQFEEGTGTTASDQTANGNDATLTGNTDWTSGSTVCSTCNIVMTQTATVTVNPPLDNTVTNDGTSLTANLATASYQWLDCDDNNSPINGETNQTYNPTSTGNFAVEISATGCTDTSACEAITVLNIGENGFGGNINIYPNPSKGNINIDLGQNKAVTIKLVSVEGKEVFEENLNDNFITLDISSYPQGIYILQISDGENESFHRIIKK